MENKISFSIEEVEDILNVVASLPIGQRIPNTDRLLSVLFLNILQRYQQKTEEMKKEAIEFKPEISKTEEN